MADNSNSRKKALIISVLAFLFAGGGIFLFFVVQGANDITGAGKKNTFSYGFAVREAVLPLFKRMGFSTYEDEVEAANKKRLEARGFIAPAASAAAPADVSDWMAQAPSAAPSPSSRSGAPTSVPKMAGRAGSPVGGASAGGSKSAGGVTRFGPGSSSGMTSVSGKGQAGAQGVTEKGTLAALKNSRALLGEGLRSNSAMTASNKWNQSFGVGSSAGGGALAYNKSGLVALDKIKSGEISNLKMDKKGSLKTPDVTSPVKDEDGTGKALSGDKKFKEDLEAKTKSDAAKAATQAALDAMDKETGKKKDDGEGEGPQGKGAEKPPKEVQELIEGSKPPDHCPDGCTTPDGGSYTDTKTETKKEGDLWTVTRTGTGVTADGTKYEYSDTWSVGGKPPALIPYQSVVNGKVTDFGTGP